MQYPTLRLNPKACHRLRHGHLWIYSNEVDAKANSLQNFKAGDLAVVQSALGETLGLCYVNPNTLIAGRMLSKDPSIPLNHEFFRQRIQKALDLRQMLFPSNCYRLIYGESDNLPGLVVDRFYDVLVVQISTAGMENFIEFIISALDELIQPTTILLKNDGKMRAVENLPSIVKWLKGDAISTTLLEENGVKFQAPILEGQKTGWFYDHRQTRARLANYVKGKTVLDVFSYIGGWGIQAGAFGAKHVTFNDVSDFALQHVATNAKLNHLDNISTIQGDAFETMQSLIKSNNHYDVVILDPPAFIPKRRDLAKGLAAYQKANLLAAKLLNPQGGILVSGSCSMHLPHEDLCKAIHRAGYKLNKTVQILEQGHQGPDHPIHPAIPETSYLKAFIAKLTRG